MAADGFDRLRVTGGGGSDTSAGSGSSGYDFDQVASATVVGFQSLSVLTDCPCRLELEDLRCSQVINNSCFRVRALGGNMEATSGRRTRTCRVALSSLRCNRSMATSGCYIDQFKTRKCSIPSGLFLVACAFVQKAKV